MASVTFKKINKVYDGKVQALVNDLTNAFQEWSNVKCYTLHKYALKINHLTDYYILDSEEQLILDDIKDY